MRWGILGTARINQKIIPNLKSYKDADLVSVASRHLEKAQEYAKSHGIPKAFGSYDLLLKSKDIDAVYISIPNFLHVEWTKKALLAGKHVLCEKPLALTAEEVKMLAEIAREKGLLLAEAFMYRHQKQTMDIKNAIEDGVIGQIRSLKASFHFELKDKDDIRLSRELGGGSLWDIGCYPVNLIRYLVGYLPKDVFGWSLNETTDGIDRQFTGILKFPNQISGTIECSFDAPANHFLEVTGSKGTIRVSHPFKAQEIEKFSIVFENKEEQFVEIRDLVNPYLAEIIDFTESALERRTQKISLTESHDTTLIIESLYRSWREERPICLSSQK